MNWFFMTGFPFHGLSNHHLAGETCSSCKFLSCKLQLKSNILRWNLALFKYKQWHLFQSTKDSDFTAQMTSSRWIRPSKRLQHQLCCETPAFFSNTLIFSKTKEAMTLQNESIYSSDKQTIGQLIWYILYYIYMSWPLFFFLRKCRHLPWWDPCTSQRKIRLGESTQLSHDKKKRPYFPWNTACLIKDPF